MYFERSEKAIRLERIDQIRQGEGALHASTHSHSKKEMEALNHAAQAPDASVAVSAFHQSLQHCCGSNEWVKRMQTRFPFASLSAMCAASDDVDGQLSTEDWLEAFAAHPRVRCVDMLSFFAVSCIVLTDNARCWNA